MPSSSEALDSRRPFNRLINVFRRPNRSDRLGSLISLIRPERPRRSSNSVDLIANGEGNRALQSARTFETQGIVLSVNIDRSSLQVVKRNDSELEISGRADCNVSCQVEAQGESWKQLYKGTLLTPGLSQAFSVVIPNVNSSVPRTFDLIISESDTEAKISELNRDGRFANPYYINQLYTTISVSIRENGFLDMKVQNQYVKLRSKNFILLEIYGKPTSVVRSNISSPTSYCSDGLSNKDCIVCLTELKDTIVLPCRHMCLCSDCADTIRSRSDKCPLCRQGFRALLHIRYN